MIPKKDIYVDKHGNLTSDPSKYAAQVAVAGCHLDDRLAKRYGIVDELVSVDEPSAPRRIMGTIPKPVKVTEPEPKAETPEAEAAEPEAEKAAPVKPAKKAEAKKGEKSK